MSALIAAFDALIQSAGRLKAALDELADEGQQRGEIATNKDGHIIRDSVLSPDTMSPATLTDLGITRQQLHEVRGEIEGHGGARNFKVASPDLEPVTFADFGSVMSQNTRRSHS